MRVCPLFQCRLDESFGLAVGLWPVRPGSFMLYTELTTGFTKFAGFAAGPVIRKDTLDLHALRRIPGNGMPEELHSGFRRLIRVDRCAGHPRSVINANMRIFPARTAAINLPRSRLSVSHTVDPAQTLDIQMRHLSGLFSLITPHRRLCLQCGKTRAAKFTQGAKDRTPAQSQPGRYLIPGQTPLPWRESLCMSFPSACRDSAGGAFVHKRFNAAMPGLFRFQAVHRLRPNPVARADAGMLSGRRIISSRPLGVRLAFLWLFTLFLVRLLALVWEPPT